MTDQSGIAYILDETDNVATLPWGGRAAEAIRLRGATPEDMHNVVLTADIPPGHKCALHRIEQDRNLVKYGSSIGMARQDISAGDHVHVHNVFSRLSPAPARSDKAQVADAVILPNDLITFVSAVLQAAGASPQSADDMATHCAAAEACGVDTHGIRRIQPVIQRLKSGGIDGSAEPVIARHGGILNIDGKNALGHHVTRVAADAAISVARELGVAVALIRNSNHFGYAGYYAERIARAGLVGMAISNGQVFVGPPGAREAIFSNNPLALAAPMGRDRVFEFDMAASVTSRAKIAQAAEAGLPIEPGLALDAQGRPTQDAAEAVKGILLPLGGAKGFGLIAALEVLTGVLPGGAYANQVLSKEASPDQPDGTSHFLMAIAPDTDGDEGTFAERMADLCDRVAAMAMAPGQGPARLPGARRTTLRENREKDGIPLSASALKTLKDLCTATGAELTLASKAT